MNSRNRNITEGRPWQKKKWISLTFLFLLLFGSGISAQEVTWSEAFREDRNQKGIKMIGASQGAFYVLKSVAARDHNQELEVFDARTMEKRFSHPVKLPKIGKNETRLEKLLLVKNKLLLFSSYFDKDDDRLRCYGTWLDEKGSPLELPVLLGDVASRSRRTESPFGFELSADSSLVLVHFSSDLERKGNERFTLKVIDASLETLWQKDIELPYRSEIIEITQYALDNSGQVYMMSGISGDKSTAGNDLRLSDKRYVLLSYDPVLNKIKEFNVELNSKWVVATTFGITDEGDLAIGGFYSNDRVFSIAGTFYFRIDGKKKEINAKGLHAFETGFLNQFMNERNARNGRELYDFYFDHFALHPDGSATFVAEQYYVLQRFRSDITTGRQQILYYYHYNDIIVVRFNKDGSLRFLRKIPKEQVTVNDKGPFSSYAFAQTKDSIYVLFNDHPDNTALLKENPEANVKSYNGARQSEVVEIAIGKDGVMQRTSLFKSRKDDTILKPKVHLYDGMDRLFIYASYRRQYRFGRMKFSP